MLAEMAQRWPKKLKSRETLPDGSRFHLRTRRSTFTIANVCDRDTAAAANL